MIRSLILSLLFASSASASQLHVFVVTDTEHPKDAAYFSADSEVVSSCLHEMVPTAQLNLIQIGTSDGWGKLTTELHELKVAQDDAIFVYVSTHGSWTQTLRFNYLLGEAVIERAELIRAIRLKDCRLGILISDACASIPGDVDYKRRNLTRTYAPHFLTQPKPLAQKLFFDSRGFVDIISSQKGESSYFYLQDGGAGSLFTNCLVEKLSESKDQTLSWGQIYAAVKTDSSREYKRLKELYPKAYPQKSVTPFAFGLDTPDGRNKFSFGFSIVDGEPAGARVTKIQPGFPAAQAGLQVDDIILSMNGKKFTIAQQLGKMLHSSSTPCTFEVLRDGQRMTIRVE